MPARGIAHGPKERKEQTLELSSPRLRRRIANKQTATALTASRTPSRTKRTDRTNGKRATLPFSFFFLFFSFCPLSFPSQTLGTHACCRRSLHTYLRGQPSPARCHSRLLACIAAARSADGLLACLLACMSVVSGKNERKGVTMTCLGSSFATCMNGCSR